MKIKTLAAISEIDATSWNRLAQAEGYNPFVDHAFFSCLEHSGCATARQGWKPQHLIMEDDGGQVIGAVPCYMKSHSMGEYVFDHGFAEAYARAGGNYYPKLQVSVPFTPVTGPRLLAETNGTRATLGLEIIDLCRSQNLSSAHITFMPENEVQTLNDQGWLLRQDIQFHWMNQGYRDFADFLDHLSSSKRKNIRKERRTVEETGISFERLSGKDLSEAHWDHFYSFYQQTASRKWGKPYLNRQFFSLLNEAMGKHILLIFAKREGRIIAGALNFIGSYTLYGRNWGAVEQHPFLHFETCYYQAIDFAIQHSLKKVEAGAQGEHKLARGYLPVKTNSLHYFAHDGLAHAVANYLEQERLALSENQAELSEHSPFRAAPNTGTRHDIEQE